MALYQGIVQLLFLQYWHVVIGGAIPLNLAGQICTKITDCKSDNSLIRHQIQKQLLLLNSSAGTLYDTYVHCQGFHPNLNIVCNKSYGDFPKYNLSKASEEEKLVEMFKIFTYMTAALGNITTQQKQLNPKQHHLLKNLTRTLSSINAIISNLSCVLCKKYHVTDVNVYYGKYPSSNPFEQKQMGCQVLRIYKHFISEAADSFAPSFGEWMDTMGH
ncbi:leukemia inhibitory factor [Bombina bombina]|uniref:leukemia inhibitory factor n=1 Tax=Bombina bombina TaxID=8345 RepID=UPI00235A526B|nr:leukemia inhibitory factor [Bombina bombina]